MNVIYKYVFGDINIDIRMGERDLVRHVGLDPVTQKAAVWIEHDLDVDTGSYSDIRFRLVMTGETFKPAEIEYVGTVQQGRLMLHIYEEL